MILRICYWICLVLLLCGLQQSRVHAFHIHTTFTRQHQQHPSRLHGLFMGRASVVRANTKARTDAAKAKNNNRFAKKIIISVKAGGADLAVNRQLAQVVADAKAANVPKDIISRNIEKASSTVTMDYKESTFEFYGHGGVGLLVHVLTDNDNRAAADVALVAKKQLLRPAANNSVKFKFQTKARLDIKYPLLEEEVMMLCLQHGVDDYDLHAELDGSVLSPSEDGSCVLLVDLKDMAVLRDALRDKGIAVETKLQAVPVDGFVSVSDEDFELNMAAVRALEALDDVDSVEHNIDLLGDDDDDDDGDDEE